jgi:hypothetical protein
MAFTRRDDLRDQIRTVATEILPSITIGDPPLAAQVAAKLRDQPNFAHRTDSGVYQIVCYYLRDMHLTTKDNRKRYDKKLLSQLVIMSAPERREFCEKTNRSMRALDAALARYRAWLDKERNKPVVIRFVASDIQEQGYIDFSKPAQLHHAGTSTNAVKFCRTYLSNELGLSLRAPNLLYHPKTRRVYALTAAEQIALLDSPRQFMKKRADHIREHWVVRETDPVDDADVRPTRSKTSGYMESPDGSIDLTRPKRRKGVVEKGFESFENLITHLSVDHLTQDNPLYEQLTRIHDKTHKLLGWNNVLNSAVDHVTGTPEPLNNEEPFTGFHPVTVQCGSIEEMLGAEPVDEDAWMDNFKPVSATE